MNCERIFNSRCCQLLKNYVGDKKRDVNNKIVAKSWEKYLSFSSDIDPITVKLIEKLLKLRLGD